MCRGARPIARLRTRGTAPVRVEIMKTESIAAAEAAKRNSGQVRVGEAAGVAPTAATPSAGPTVAYGAPSPITPGRHRKTRTRLPRPSPSRKLSRHWAPPHECRLCRRRLSHAVGSGLCLGRRVRHARQCRAGAGADRAAGQHLSEDPHVQMGSHFAVCASAGRERGASRPLLVVNSGYPGARLVGN